MGNSHSSRKEPQRTEPTVSLKKELENAGIPNEAVEILTETPRPISTVFIQRFCSSVSDADKLTDVLYKIYLRSGGYCQLFGDSERESEKQKGEDSPKLPPESTARFFNDNYRAFADTACGLARMLSNIERGVSPISSTQVRSQIISDREAFLLFQASSFSSAQPSIACAAQLFSLAENGESWTRFVHRIDKYEAPALILVKTASNDRCGAYLHQGVKESGTKYFGDGCSFLFHLGACPKVFMPNGRGSNYAYLNFHSQFVPQGLGFGGDMQQPRLLIRSDLRTLECSIQCATYNPGSLINMNEDGEDRFNRTVRIEALEIFGFGTEEDLRMQQSAMDRDEQNRAERRQVDRQILTRDMDLLKKPAAGERQGEVDAIVEQHREVQHSKRVHD